MGHVLHLVCGLPSPENHRWSHLFFPQSENGPLSTRRGSQLWKWWCTRYSSTTRLEGSFTTRILWKALSAKQRTSTCDSLQHLTPCTQLPDGCHRWYTVATRRAVVSRSSRAISLHCTVCALRPVSSSSS